LTAAAEPGDSSTLPCNVGTRSTQAIGGPDDRMRDAWLGPNQRYPSQTDISVLYPWNDEFYGLANAGVFQRE
jgi:hypothetical protein